VTVLVANFLVVPGVAGGAASAFGLRPEID